MKSDRRETVFMMDLWATVPYYTAYLSRSLLERGAAVTVGSISYYLDPGCFTDRGIRLRPGLLDVVGRFRLPKLPRRILKLLEGMVNLAALTLRFLVSPPDVIHVQYLAMLRWRVPLDLWFLQLCRRRSSRVVLTVHDLLPHDTGEAYKQTFVGLYSSVDAIICHSDNIRRRLETEFGVSKQKLWVIPHGPFFYDLSTDGSNEILQRLGLAGNQVLVLWQGILFPYKGVDLLLRAWREVEASGLDAYLLIAGTGAPELLEQIRQQARELKRVKLHLKFVSAEELVALYRAADVVVYPYRAITTSGALATGLALGKTIVASDLPVFREVLVDRKNALLVDLTNADALAAALIELIGEPRLREQLAGAVRAMRFGDQSWQVIAKQTIEVYESVLEHTGTAKVR